GRLGLPAVVPRRCRAERCSVRRPRMASGIRLSLSPRLRPNGGLRRGKAGHRHTEGRAGNIVKASIMEKGDRGRIAAGLPANANLEIAAHFEATLGADAHQLADTRLVDCDTR